jgi:uroporphyrinogen-III synthase
MSAPLTGLRVVNTRAARQAGELDRALIAAGALPLAFPCIEIAPPAETGPLDNALALLVSGHFSWLVLTSVNTVDALGQRGIVIPSSARVAAVGPHTAHAVRDQLGVEVTFTPTRATAADLAHTLPVAPGDRVLLPTSAIAGNEVARILTNRQASPTTVVAHDTAVGSGGIDLRAAVELGEVDALTFASPSAVRGLLARFSAAGGPPWRHFDLPAVCIGETTAKAAAAVGFTRIVTATTPSVEGLLCALAETVGHRV